jgi:peptidoglycan-N-acetylglucosamine deacetylase
MDGRADQTGGRAHARRPQAHTEKLAGWRKVAVCLSWDMDNETPWLASGDTAPVTLSEGEYGATEGLARIMALYDKYRIPGSFYIPAVTGLLYPEMIEELKKRPQHEVGIHGWIHENLVELNDRGRRRTAFGEGDRLLDEGDGPEARGLPRAQLGIQPVHA